MKHIIETENFFVCIEPEIFEADINLSTNTILKIDVNSEYDYGHRYKGLG